MTANEIALTAVKALDSKKGQDIKCLALCPDRPVRPRRPEYKAFRLCDGDPSGAR